MAKILIELNDADPQTALILAALTGGEAKVTTAARTPAYQGAAAPASAPAPAGYAPAPQGAPAPAPAPAPAAPAAPATSGITAAQVSGAAQLYSKTHGPKAAKAKLAEFGLTKVSDANPASYPQLLAAFAV